MEELNLKYDYLVLVPLLELSTYNDKVYVSTTDVIRYKEKLEFLVSQILNKTLVVNITPEVVEDFKDMHSDSIIIKNKTLATKFKLNNEANILKAKEVLKHILGHDLYEIMTMDEALSVFRKEKSKSLKL